MSNTPEDWHKHGLSWGMSDAMASPGREWTLDDIARAFAAGAAAAEAAQAQPEPTAYLARSRYGAQAHFGIKAAATAWAGDGGEVFEVPLRHLGLVSPAPAAQEQPAAAPDGRLHDDGYFTWNTKKHPPWTRPTALPCDFWLVAQPVAAMPAQAVLLQIKQLAASFFAGNDKSSKAAGRLLIEIESAATAALLAAAPAQGESVAAVPAQAQREPLSDERIEAKGL